MCEKHDYCGGPCASEGVRFGPSPPSCMPSPQVQPSPADWIGTCCQGSLQSLTPQSLSVRSKQAASTRISATSAVSANVTKQFGRSPSRPFAPRRTQKLCPCTTAEIYGGEELLSASEHKIRENPLWIENLTKAALAVAPADQICVNPSFHPSSCWRLSADPTPQQPESVELAGRVRFGQQPAACRDLSRKSLSEPNFQGWKPSTDVRCPEKRTCDSLLLHGKGLPASMESMHSPSHELGAAATAGLPPS